MLLSTDSLKLSYDNPCLTCSHMDIMYCHNCIYHEDGSLINTNIFK